MAYGSALMGKDYVEKEGDIYPSIVSSSFCVTILEDTHNNDLKIDGGYVYNGTIDEVNLHDTFLFYLFSFEMHVFVL